MKEGDYSLEQFIIEHLQNDRKYLQFAEKSRKSCGNIIKVLNIRRESEEYAEEKYLEYLKAQKKEYYNIKEMEELLGTEKSKDFRANLDVLCFCVDIIQTCTLNVSGIIMQEKMKV